MLNLSDLKSAFKNTINNPIGYLTLVINKMVFNKSKYKQGPDYNAYLYWENRFRKYGFSVKGPGHEGASIKDNEVRYSKVKKNIEELWKIHVSENPTPKTLEIGVGTGIITGLIRDLGVSDFVGIDITDYLFKELRIKFPKFSFIQSDVTKNQIDGKYDAIVIIDVLQHIVTLEKLNSAFGNLDMCLKNDGIIFLAPITNSSYKRQFYEHSWRLKDIEPLSDYKVLGEAEWTKGYSKLVVVQKPKADKL